MVNLIKSNLYRIIKEKSIYVLLILGTLGLVMINLICLLANIGAGYILTLIYATSTPFMFIIISIYMKTEFANKTIKNKIMSGIPRVKIIISDIITASIITILFIIAQIILTLAISLPLLGWGSIFTLLDLYLIIKVTTLGILFLLSFVTIYIAIAYTFNNYSISIIIYLVSIPVTLFSVGIYSLGNIDTRNIIELIPLFQLFIITGTVISTTQLIKIVVTNILYAVIMVVISIIRFNKAKLK